MQNMQHFEDAKNKLLSNLLLAQRFVEQQASTQIQESMRTIYNTLQREQFEVIVVGEFSNGKSTFINALLRDMVLPTSNVPTTSFINKINYAKEPNFKICFDNGKKQQLDKDEFLSYVSEDKQKFDQVKEAMLQKLNPLAKQATHLEIGYPTDICANNIVIIDSPGTNDMDERRVQITDEYIPKSDAAIFVLNAKKIFSASERAFLQRIMDADIQKIFFVINFKDAIKTEEDYKAIEDLVLSNLPTGLKVPKVHFVSALHALQHYVPPVISDNNPRARRRQANRLPLVETGMPELEQALFRFLTKDSGTAKIAKPVQRAVRLLREVIDQHLSFEIRSLSESIANIEQHVQEIRMKLQQEENNLQSNSKAFHRKVESESNQIVAWYKSEIVKISATAKNVLEEGLRKGEEPETIKTNIDFKTGPLEKKLNMGLKERTNKMTNHLVATELQGVSNNISSLTQGLFESSTVTSEWSGDITMSLQPEKIMNGMVVGGLLAGSASVILSGGFFGWTTLAASLGAGVGGAAVHAYNNSRDVEDQLRKQVRERYEKGLTRRAKEIEKSFEQLASEMRINYEQHTHQLIETERKRADKILANQKLSADEQEKKIHHLKQQQKLGESIIYQLNTIYQDYTKQEDLNLYV
ncbi:dynamin family protein [Solibacillus sp. MA9]|uniref:Dynamin family protein n=1 Tax=Solibacillus palustris TaxID=2908203 RepID=A0ABS9UAV1_9BACL|nr:dynamin family protein [Solibacillus sp. MA9]MCH7321482.1 dynamin family protein [Solibacillus sp. MA9]